MLRLVLLAVALTGVLATAHPASADPLAAATPSDHAQVAATATEQPVPSAPAMAPSGSERGKDLPVGFGWG
jgi:hypothetical protein